MNYKLEIEKNEVYRYLGYGTDYPDEKIMKIIDECCQKIVSVAVPRWAYRTFDIKIAEGSVILDKDILLHSYDLAKNLKTCSKAAIFCATLSQEIDKLINMAQTNNMAEAVILDACASAAIESLCDYVENLIKDENVGATFPSRFSPGYGDFSLSVQGELLNLLNASRRIGVCVTNENILTPRKSVTAVFGISNSDVQQQSCEACSMKNSCVYRPKGGKR